MTFYIHILLYIGDFTFAECAPFMMNASSWRKAADLVAQGTSANPQVQAAATAESE